MTNTDPKPLVPPDRPGCADARAGMRAFVAGTEPAVPPPAWREHMSGCTRCTLEYHQLVTDVAKLARGATGAAERTSEAFGPTREERVRQSLIASDAKHRVRLPKLFLPIAVIVLIAVVMSQSAQPRTRLTALSGSVSHGGKVLDGEQPVDVARGDACTTGAHSRARLELGKSSIRFDSDTSFLVDRTDRLSVRLFAGSARIEGDAVVLLQSCAVEVTGGAAEVELTAGELVVRCDSGKVTRTDSRGRFEILPNESSTVQFGARDVASPQSTDP